MKKAILEGARLPSFQPSSRHSGKDGLVLPRVSDAARAFAERMLNRDPKTRVSSAALLSDAYLKQSSFVPSRPSLAPVLRCAARAGAFGKRRVDASDCPLDELLEWLHEKFTGERLAHVNSLTPLKTPTSTFNELSELSTAASKQSSICLSPSCQTGEESPLPGSVDDTASI